MPNTVTVWYAIIKGSIHFKPRYGGFVVLTPLDTGIFLLSLLYNFPLFKSVFFILLQMVQRTETAHQTQRQYDMKGKEHFFNGLFFGRVDNSFLQDYQHLENPSQGRTATATIVGCTGMQQAAFRAGQM